MSPSENSKKSYKRFEFLGDRVLNLIISEYLYQKYPDISEGDLTNKLKFTSNDNLDEIIDRFNDEFKSEIAGFKCNYKTDDHGLSANDVEAFIGDYYLKHGFVAAKKFFENIFKNEVDSFDPDTDYITRLQIYTQKKWKIVPEYVQKSEQINQKNEHSFLVQVFVGRKVYGEGCGSRKSRANKKAALDALKKLGQIQ
jgi:ribonuclease III